MCLVPNVVFVSGLFTLDSFFGIFLSSFVVLCQIFPVYLDCSLVIASLEGFLSSFCVLCPKLPLSLDYSLLMTSSGFILSSFCALCLVLLVSLDCLIGGFVVVLCLVSSVAGVSGLPNRFFIVGLCRVPNVTSVSGVFILSAFKPKIAAILLTYFTYCDGKIHLNMVCKCGLHDFIYGRVALGWMNIFVVERYMGLG